MATLESQDYMSILSNIVLRIKRFQFGNKSQLAFLEDLYLLIDDGIPANRAVEMMAQVATGITRDVALSISQKVSEGRPLADGMRDWFAINVIEIIRAGEEGGALAETLKSAINTLSQRGSNIGALVSAMSYPIMVIVIACAVIVYLDNSVFEQFKALKPIEQWPEAGQSLVAIANVIENWWWLLLSSMVVVALLLRYVMHNYTGEFRSVLDHVFPFNLYRRFAAARMMETLGLLVANGVVFKSAIKVMEYQSNPYLTSHLIMMEHLLGAGKGNVADVLATGLIDDSDVMRLRIMAEVKGFEHGLIRMGVRGSEKTTKTLNLIAKILGGTLLAVGAYLIIIIIRGIYLTGMAMGS